jgi:hypothetical protein
MYVLQSAINQCLPPPHDTMALLLLLLSSSCRHVVLMLTVDDVHLGNQWFARITTADRHQMVPIDHDQLDQGPMQL